MSENLSEPIPSKWDCKYHVVCVPKRRRKAIFGQTRWQLVRSSMRWLGKRSARSSRDI
jgi:REP element-mobilizing transposase RayT